LKSHLNVVHFKIKQYFCDCCRYSTNIFKNRRRHMRRHQRTELKKTHACHICGKSVSGQRSLESHIEYCHEIKEKTFQCFCGKSYKRKTELQQHTRLFHEKKYSYFCKVCDKSYSNATYYRDHMQNHDSNGKKKFACETCGKLFALESLLKQHQKIHQEPTVACEHSNCPKMFHVQALAKKHYKQTHLRESRACEFCGKSVSVQIYRRHIKEFHEGLKKVNCGIFDCKSSFICRDNYRCHVKKTHANYFNGLNKDEMKAILNRSF
jgi:KRAB domain-containing zinc finger protein